MRPFADQNIITQTLLYGGIDLETRVPPRDISEIQGDSHFELSPYSTLSYSFFGYNLRNPLLAIDEVRKAISYAINRQEMLNSFFEGKGQLISGPFAPGSWAYNLDIDPIPYSPEISNRLLDRAGFTEKTKEGIRVRGSYELVFRMVVPISKENETTKRVILAFQNYLKDIGIKTQEVVKSENMPLKGEKFVFTGGLQSLSRPDASDVVKQKGGIVSSSVSRDTDYVVVGEKPGSKFEKAKKLGLKILDEEEFRKLVGK